MQWNIISEIDLNDLNDKIGCFHDSCVREMHVWTETSIDQNLKMSCASNLDFHIRLFFQRQYIGPSAFEFQFDEVIGFQWSPTPENYDSIILQAEISFEKGIFYWREHNLNWIGGRKLKWRDVSEWMGSELRYGSG